MGVEIQNILKERKREEKTSEKINSENVSTLPFGYASKFLRKNRVGPRHAGSIFPIL